MPRFRCLLPVLVCAILFVYSPPMAAAEEAVGAGAPATALDAAPAVPDFAAIRDVQQRKAKFFAYLLPHVRSENERLLKVRRRLEHIRDHVRFQRPVPPDDLAWLVETAHSFGVEEVDPHEPGFWDDLYERVDALPAELVLVQAAMETAWGTSRFARQGNNYFGQWCFDPGCGIVPSGREAGADHEVASFDSVTESVRSYLMNLNTGRAYRRLRSIRSELRSTGRKLDAAAVADGLHAYSERGDDYVEEIRAMLRQNQEMIGAARRRAAAQASGE